MKTFVIAEAGVNHNGDTDKALQLVEIAARCGADAVKFQTFKAETLVRPGAEKVAYQKRETGEGDQFEMLKKLEMSEELHRQLVLRCNELGIEFMSTPFDGDAADFLAGLGMRRLKVPSGEITNHPFLRKLAQMDLPIILSTGMATLAEVSEAVEVIRLAREEAGLMAPLESVLTILHCTSNYPAALGDVNLLAMRTIADATGIPVGYSDHTDGTVVAIAAVALGACVIEKHFTLDRNLPGPDHKASLEPEELALMVSQIRAVDLALGSSEKAPTESEREVRGLVRRSVASTRDIAAGEVLTVENTALLRPGTGIQPKDYAAVLGRLSARAVKAGQTIGMDDLQ